MDTQDFDFKVVGVLQKRTGEVHCVLTRVIEATPRELNTDVNA